MPARAEVEIDIFSGMPNPTWVLTSAEAAFLVKQVAALPRASARERPGNLGYRGLIVRITLGADIQLVRVRAGTVYISKGETELHANDEGRALEKWLLETGKPHLKSDLIEIVEREVR